MFNVRDSLLDENDKRPPNDTAAIQSAIEAAATAGGGVVLVPALDPAKYQPAHYRIEAAASQCPITTRNSGIYLRDNVHLVLERGAVLQALATDKGEYAIIHGVNVSNVSITGFGTIRGEWAEHKVYQITGQAKSTPGQLDRLELRDATVGKDFEAGSFIIVHGGGANNTDLQTKITGKTIKVNGEDVVVGAQAADTEILLVDPVQTPVEDVTVTILAGADGMGIRLYGVMDFTIRDITVENCWGDGIYIAGDSANGPNETRHQCRRFTIENVIARRNRRNNLAISHAHSFAVRGGQYYLAGCPTALLSVTKPVIDRGTIGARVGIDLEHEWTEPSDDWKTANPEKYEKMDKKWLWHIEDGEISGVCAFNNGYDGIHVIGHAAHDIDIHDCHCSGNGDKPEEGDTVFIPKDKYKGGSGIHIVRTGRAVCAHGNTCHNNGFGIRVNGNASNYFMNGVDENCVSAPSVCDNVCNENGQQGILIEDNVEFGRVSDNTCARNGEEGILANATDNEHDPSATPPTFCEWPVRDCLFSHNTCYANNRADDAKSNMALTGHCYRNSVQGNVCRSGVSQAPFPEHGLHIGPQCYENYVCGSDLRDGGPQPASNSGDFLDDGVATDSSGGNAVTP